MRTRPSILNTPTIPSNHHHYHTTPSIPTNYHHYPSITLNLSSPYSTGFPLHKPVSSVPPPRSPQLSPTSTPRASAIVT